MNRELLPARTFPLAHEGDAVLLVTARIELFQQSGNGSVMHGTGHTMDADM